MNLKKTLRLKIKFKIAELSEHKKAELSDLIHKLFIESEVYSRAESIACYCADLQNEVATRSLISRIIRDGKKISLPSVDPKTDQLEFYRITNPDCDLVKGRWGIEQPNVDKTEKISFKGIDLVIVPGVGFSPNGDRLGRGKGYYDRWLSQLADSVLKVALAFNEQISTEIFSETHDIPVDVLITPQQIHHIRSKTETQEFKNE